MIWDIWRPSRSLNEEQTWASMKRFGTPQCLQLLCHFPKQKIRNSWHGVTKPVCQSSEKAPGSTVLHYQFISSQLTLSPIKKFIRPFFFFYENHAPLWLATSMKMEFLSKYFTFYCLAQTYGKGLCCMNIWHRALSCRMYWCLKLSIMSSLDGE